MSVVRRSRSLVAVVLLACASVPSSVLAQPSPDAPQPASERAVPRTTRGGRLLVVDNNIENLETRAETSFGPSCGGDWKDLVYAMRNARQIPDVFIVQQLSGPRQMRSLVRFMEDQLGRNYSGRIALEQPKAMRSPCGASKRYQTNAVIYRTGRLAPIAGTKDVWQAQHQGRNGCVNNVQARTRAIAVGFRDRLNGEKVLIGSIHWPTNRSGGGTSCSVANARETVAHMNRGTYSLRIFGGDTNVSDRTSTTYRPWYRSTRDAAFRDPVYFACSRASGSTRGCLADNDTTGARIDYLWAKKTKASRPTVSGVDTISFRAGDAADRTFTGADNPSSNASGRYSDHRAVRSYVNY